MLNTPSSHPQIGPTAREVAIPAAILMITLMVGQGCAQVVEARQFGDPIPNASIPYQEIRIDENGTEYVVVYSSDVFTEGVVVQYLTTAHPDWGTYEDQWVDYDGNGQPDCVRVVLGDGTLVGIHCETDMSLKKEQKVLKRAHREIQK